jgi:hypothetical protein
MPVGLYEIRVTFRVPLDFAFRWCTDYNSDDPGLEGESYRRQVLERRKDHVVYEDLDSTPAGWMWSRWNVVLKPPDRWFGRAVGNYRGWNVRYRLSARPGGRTELWLRGRRHPMQLGTVNPRKSELEAELRANWTKFGRAMEADYRRSLRPSARSKRSRA